MTARADPAALAARSISANDLAARLESNGLGDAYAQRLGYTDIFHLADRLFAVRGESLPQPVVTRVRRSTMPQALLRAAVLALGMVLSVLALPPTTPLPTIAAAGACSWFAAHVTASFAWSELGQRGTAGVSAVLRPAFVAGLVLMLTVSVVTGATAPLVWGLWGVAAGVLLPTVATGRLAGSLALATLPPVILTVTIGAYWGSLAATLVIVSVVGVAGYRLWTDRASSATGRLPWFRRLARPDIRIPAGQACVQVGVQVGLFLALLFALPPEGRAGVGFGCLVAAVLADPLLTAVEAMTDHCTHQARGWGWLQVRVVALAVAATIAVITLAALVAYAWPTLPQYRPAAAAVTALVSLVGLTISIPLRAGWGRRATHNALLATAPGLTGLLLVPILPMSMLTDVLISLPIVAALAVHTHVCALNSPNRW